MYQLVFVKVWSGNILLPKASIIKSIEKGKVYNFMPTNRYKNHTWRLKPMIIKKQVSKF